MLSCTKPQPLLITKWRYFPHLIAQKTFAKTNIYECHSFCCHTAFSSWEAEILSRFRPRPAAVWPGGSTFAPGFSRIYTPGNSCNSIERTIMTGRASTLSPESSDYLPGSTAAEKRSLAKWYAAARAALARNRPLTTATTPASFRRPASDLSASEAAALRSVGAFKDETPLEADNDPLIRSQAQYMALLEESLSAAEAAKLLHVDVSRVRQRLRERSLFGIEHEGSWRLPRFQFERRLVIPGLAQILKALPTDLFPLDVVDWFVLPDSDLQLDSDTAPLNPREWLLSGRPVEAVVKLASDLTRA
jgi:hypothetical protein